MLRTGGVGEPANNAFLGDYSPYTDVTISFDIRVDSLTNFLGDQIGREIGISLIDRDIMGPSGASGVFFSLGIVSAATTGDWTNLSVTIADPTQSALPAGWIGFGDEDPNTFEPILPPGATFASVLASVDEFQITGGVPGFFFTDANFDMRIDNVSITIPAPTGLAAASGPLRRDGAGARIEDKAPTPLPCAPTSRHGGTPRTRLAWSQGCAANAASCGVVRGVRGVGARRKVLSWRRRIHAARPSPVGPGS